MWDRNLGKIKIGVDCDHSRRVSWVIWVHIWYGMTITWYGQVGFGEAKDGGIRGAQEQRYRGSGQRWGPRDQRQGSPGCPGSNMAWVENLDTNWRPAFRIPPREQRMHLSFPTQSSSMGVGTVENAPSVSRKSHKSSEKERWHIAFGHKRSHFRCPVIFCDLCPTSSAPTGPSTLLAELPGRCQNYKEMQKP